MEIDDSEYLITPDNLESHIKSIEFLCRHSDEYHLYLKNVYNEFEYITSPDFLDLSVNSSDVTIEMHHIITLHDLCNIVGTKLLTNADATTKLTDFDVAREVMSLHMQDLIPVCIISKTYHELIHSGQRQLSPDIPMLHLGNYQEFIKEYHEYLTQDDYDKYIACGVPVEELRKEGMTCEITKAGPVLPV